MLLRYLAIFVLVLIALRLLGRLIRAFTGSDATRESAVRREASGESRRLEPCAHCGTYFDPGRALEVRTEVERFCSRTCLETHALEDDGA